MPYSFSAILMASGFSRRFGVQNKLLAPFLGLPLAQHTLRLLCAHPAYRSIYFVCASPALAQMAAAYPVHIVNNLNPGRGSCESVRLGVSLADTDFYHFFPCDQPLLDKATLDSLLAAASPGHITVPTENGHPKSPSLFSASFRQELMSLADGESGSILRTRHAAQLIIVPIKNALALKDADTPEELEALEQAAKVMWQND